MELPQPGSIFQGHLSLFREHFHDAGSGGDGTPGGGITLQTSPDAIDDADTPAKWYYKLKAAYVVSGQTGQPLDHQLKERVTLRWKS